MIFVVVVVVDQHIHCVVTRSWCAKQATKQRSTCLGKQNVFHHGQDLATSFDLGFHKYLLLEVLEICAKTTETK